MKALFILPWIVAAGCSPGGTPEGQSQGPVDLAGTRWRLVGLLAGTL